MSADTLPLERGHAVGPSAKCQVVEHPAFVSLRADTLSVSWGWHRCRTFLVACCNIQTPQGCGCQVPDTIELSQPLTQQLVGAAGSPLVSCAQTHRTPRSLGPPRGWRDASVDTETKAQSRCMDTKALMLCWHRPPANQLQQACQAGAETFLLPTAVCSRSTIELTISPVGAMGARIRPPLPLACTCTHAEAHQQQRL